VLFLWNTELPRPGKDWAGQVLLFILIAGTAGLAALLAIRATDTLVAPFFGFVHIQRCRAQDQNQYQN